MRHDSSSHNGVIKFNLGARGLWKQFSLVGGPYAAFPENGYFGVCLREQVPTTKAADVHLPIDDFSVPKDPDKVVRALKEVIIAAMLGEVIYVGCMGGFGRTGLFIALVAKAVGIENPVRYTREHYFPSAVETPEQARYVENFDVSWFKPWLLRTQWDMVRGKGEFATA